MLNRTAIGDVPALRALVARRGSGNDYAAKLACGALRKLGKRAADAVPELLRAARSSVSFGCPQRFCDATAAILKIGPPPPELVDICVKHLKVNNYGIQKTAIETLLSIGSPAARDALRRIDKLRHGDVMGKPMDRLLARVREETH